MANITRIKASDSGKSPEKPQNKPKDTKKAKAPKDTPKAEKALKKAEKASKKPFIIIRPFVYLGRYIKESWQETRQVRWPSRKATWKLFFAILIYTLIFVGIIMLLDALFSWLFSLILG